MRKLQTKLLKKHIVIMLLLTPLIVLSLVVAFKSKLLAQYNSGGFNSCGYGQECNSNRSNNNNSNAGQNDESNRGQDLTPTKLVEPLNGIGGVLNPVINWVNEVPDAQKHQLPFYGWAFLAFLAIILIIQALIDKHKTNQLLAVTDKLRQTLQEQKNFIRLVSHHLNTPLATSKNSLELLKNSKPPEPQAINSIKPAVINLSNTVDSATMEVVGNSDNVILANFNTQPSVSFKNTITRWYFILPISLSIIVSIVLNLGLTKIETNNKATYLIFQIITGIMVTIIFANMIRLIRISRQRYKITQNINKSVSDLTTKRAQIIKALGSSLQTITANIKNGTQQINNPQIKNIMSKGILMLSKLSGIMNLLFSPISPATPTSIQSAITAVIARYQPAIEAKNITLTTDLKVPPSTAIHTNEFTFILSSMLENAIEFSKDSGEINILANQNNDILNISVTDNGSGIESDEINRLFQPFSTTNDVLTYNHNGLGLSLYTGKQILDKIGGKISISSKPSQGTTASFVMPIA